MGFLRTITLLPQSVETTTSNEYYKYLPVYSTQLDIVTEVKQFYPGMVIEASKLRVLDNEPTLNKFVDDDVLSLIKVKEVSRTNGGSSNSIYYLGTPKKIDDTTMYVSEGYGLSLSGFRNNRLVIWDRGTATYLDSNDSPTISNDGYFVIYDYESGTGKLVNPVQVPDNTEYPIKHAGFWDSVQLGYRMCWLPIQVISLYVSVAILDTLSVNTMLLLVGQICP